MTNEEKFLNLVSQSETQTVERALARKKRRTLLRFSGQIAIKILTRLDELQWTQKRLAEEMKVSPQQVNKWVKGNANFKLETLLDLGMVLEIQLIEVPKPQSRIFESETLMSETSQYKSEVKIIRFKNDVEVSITSDYQNKFLKKIAN